MKAVKNLALPAALAIGALLVLSSGGQAAASVPNWVGVTQTVLASTSADGQVSGTPSVYTQLAANGSGPVTVKVPMSRSGFRNLTGLGTPPVTDGKAVWNLHLTGPFTERTVAHFPAARLPLQVTATYYLNGHKMPATDIVGKSGFLQVIYIVANTTSEATPVTFKNVFGHKQSTSVQTPVPYAASLAVTLPTNFTNLHAPGASAAGNGNGTTGISWTMFLFEPLGSAQQEFSYQAQVTDVAIPSATLSAQALPPGNLKPLPTIHEPGAPAVPTVTVGGRLASFQAKAQNKLQDIAAKASTFLSELKKVLVPAAQHVSGGAAKLAVALRTLSADAQQLSTNAGDLSARLAQHATDAASTASMIADIQTRFAALPAAICGALSPSPSPSCVPKVRATKAYTTMHAKLAALQDLALRLSAALGTSSADAKALKASALSASAGLATSATNVGALSAKAAQVATAIANASTTITVKKGKAIQPTTIGGGAKLDAAVKQLDDAISQAGATVDDNYAYLTALETQAGQNLMPASNASGATAQAGALSYSIGGADNSARQIHLALIIGVTGLFIGATLGLGLYRIRRGEASSLAPAKTKPQASPKRA